MKTRAEFHQKLVEALGSPFVYFQPPENIKMHQGNRIVYSRERIDYSKADNQKYIGHTKYSVILLSKDPDWSLVQEFPTLFRYCEHDRSYVSDNINHNAYITYY